jgi:hypothetical protein
MLQHKMEIGFKPKRIFPIGIEGIVFYMDFNSGYIPIDKYPPFAVLINNTIDNFKNDLDFGNLLEFNGINEKILLTDSSNPQLNISANQKFTFGCRFRYLSAAATHTLFGRRQSGRFNGIITDSVNISTFIHDDLGVQYNINIPFDTNWHTIYYGFDGTTWFIEIDGSRSINSVNSHGGMTVIPNWGIGGEGQLPLFYAHCQISELGLIKGASL